MCFLSLSAYIKLKSTTAMIYDKNVIDFVQRYTSMTINMKTEKHTMLYSTLCFEYSICNYGATKLQYKFIISF